MYGDDKKTIERLVDLVEDNNKILHRLQRAKRWSSFFYFFYWVVALLLAAGSYYYIQPYVESLQKVLPQLDQTIKSLPIPGWGTSASTTPR